MKNWKKYMSLLLALVMCLIMAACGGGNGYNDDDIIDGFDDTAPDTIENLVTDASVEFDYSAYMGTWLGEDDSVLVMEHVEGITNSERFRLNGADQALLASGNIQYVEEYGYVYLYNEHSGIAHICWFNEDNTLYIDSFGTFTKVSGDVPGDTIGDEYNPAPSVIDSLVIDDSVEYDYSVLLGTWLGGYDSVLAVEEYDDGRVHYILSNAYNDWTASGLFQYVEEYGCVYAHNDYDGFAYLCSFNEDATLSIEYFGTFTKVSGDVPGETVGDEVDTAVLSGSWYLDGDIYGSKCIEFDASGTIWTYYERGDNGFWDGVDGGTLRVTGANRYEAVSGWYDSKTYDFYLENGMLYWGSEDGGYEAYY